MYYLDVRKGRQEKWQQLGLVPNTFGSNSITSHWKLQAISCMQKLFGIYTKTLLLQVLCMRQNNGYTAVQKAMQRTTV
jgi:hypothetical protein